VLPIKSWDLNFQVADRPVQLVYFRVLQWYRGESGQASRVSGDDLRERVVAPTGRVDGLGLVVQPLDAGRRERQRL
jgi:hypothetical protein